MDERKWLLLLGIMVFPRVVVRVERGQATDMGSEGGGVKKFVSEALSAG